MNPDKTAIIKYSQEFVTPYGTKAWVGFEMPVPADSPYLDDEFKEVLSKVRNWGELATQTSYQSQPLTNTPITEFEKIADIAIDRTPQSVRDKILEEQMLKEDCLRLPDGTGGLLSWSTLVNSNPALRPAYDKRMKELQSQQ